MSTVVPRPVGINWNKYWFVLNDCVLYYFEGPEKQDQSPRCIIPLEGIDVRRHGAIDLSISHKVKHRVLPSLLGHAMLRLL